MQHTYRVRQNKRLRKAHEDPRRRRVSERKVTSPIQQHKEDAVEDRGEAGAAGTEEAIAEEEIRRANSANSKHAKLVGEFGELGPETE